VCVCVCVCVCVAHISSTGEPSGMDYNFFKYYSLCTSINRGIPELKTFCAVRPKRPLAGVKKAVIQQEKLHSGLAFCRDSTGTP